MKQTLDSVGLAGYPKTTGGDGMHVYVPLEPVYTFEQVRSFAEILSILVIRRNPDLFTTPRTVSQRKKGKVYFDYLQISSAKTIAAPYVLRAYPGAPVSTPLDWSEVQPGLEPKQFNIHNALDRFDRVGDLFDFFFFFFFCRGLQAALEIWLRWFRACGALPSVPHQSHAGEDDQHRDHLANADRLRIKSQPRNKATIGLM